MDSLLLAVEMFNRPHDIGRATSVLILLDHGFEMLLKASILHKGGKVREPRAKQTIGFDACVRRAVTDARVKFLSDEQALTVQAINGLRDAAQHHIVEISEAQLYVHCMAGLTLFRDILKSVFGQDLAVLIPARVLPLSTQPAVDLVTIFENEVEAIKNLLAPGKRRLSQATARLRPLEILESTIQGQRTQPGEGELEKKCRDLIAGKALETLFPNVTSLRLSSSGEGSSLQLRFTKKEGIPIHVVPEGTDGAFPVAIKRVNELDFYNLGLAEVSAKVELTEPKTLAVILHLGLQASGDYFKLIRIGKAKYKRYSQKAVTKIQEALPGLDIGRVWKDYRSKKQQRIV